MQTAMRAAHERFDPKLFIMGFEKRDFKLVEASLEILSAHIATAIQALEPVLKDVMHTSIRYAGKDWPETQVRAAASKLGIPFKAGTPAYHKAYNELKKGKPGHGAAVGTPDPAAPAEPVPAPLSAERMQKIGGQAGSNPGGLYQDTDGTKYYIKQGRSEAHVQNEVLAGKLYEELGVASPQLSLATMNGKAAIASKIVPKELVGPDALASLPGTAEGFVADAWLANWDVAGLSFDNLASSNGKAMRLDTGGALLFRAQGKPKGAAFGSSVTEFDTFRNPNINPQSARLFKNVTDAHLKAGIDSVLGISDDRIRQLVKEHGPKGVGLDDLLIARKADLRKRRNAL